MSDWHIKTLKIEPNNANAAFRPDGKIHALDNGCQTLCGRDATRMHPVYVEGRDGGFPKASDEVCRICAQNFSRDG